MDTVDKKQRRRIMSKIWGKDSKLEILVRKHLRAQGWCYRVCDKWFPGHPDVVLTRCVISLPRI
ncbi:MAG: hypothetical protein J6Y56_05030 [Fibrobacterales bacterium]|nr:hypothetical protein [Fibrobacterales bacterium]